MKSEPFLVRFPRPLAILLTVFALVTASLIAVPGSAVASGTYTVSGHVSLGTSDVSAGAGDVLVYISDLRTDSPLLDSYTAQDYPTDASGNFSIPGVPDDTYSLYYNYVGSGEFGSTWMSGTPTSPGTGFTVNGADVSGQNITLAPYLTVQSAVDDETDPTYTPAASGAVTVNWTRQDDLGRTSQNLTGSTVVGANGVFTVTVPAGFYTFQYVSNLPDWSSQSSTNQVYIGDGTVLQNALLTGVATVSGHVDLGVTGNSAGANAVNIYLCTAENCSESESAQGTPVGTTDASGNYSVTESGTTGEMWLYFVDKSGAYQPGQVSFVAPDLAPHSFPNENLTLTTSGSISGVVDLGSSGPAPVGSVQVRLSGAPTGPEDINVAADGSYSFTGLSSGTYLLDFVYTGSSGYASAWWTTDALVGGVLASTADDASSITVGTSAVTGRSITLPMGAYISGTILNSLGQPTTAPVEAMELYRSAGGLANVETTENFNLELVNGTYSIGPLLPGDYSVVFSGSSDYYWLPSYGNDAPYDLAWAGSTAAEPWLADTYDLSAGETQTDADAVQYIPASVSLQVSCSNCNPILDVDVHLQVHDPVADDWLDVYATDIDGTGAFDFAGLYPGSYRAVAEQWSDGSVVAQSPTNFTVAEGVGYPETFDFTAPEDSISLPSWLSGGVGDITSDGNPDVVARDSSGALWVYPGNGSNGLEPRIELSPAGGPWATAAAIIPVGYFTGGDYPDMMLLDQSGNLWLYPGEGESGFGTPIKVGDSSEWAGMTAIQGVGDFDGDGWPDVVARDAAGNLWLYPNNGSGTGFGTRYLLATEANDMTAIVGAGDWNQDGVADLITRDTSGALWLFPGDGSGGLSAPVQIGTGWQGFAIAAVGDFNHDGAEDLIARDSNGVLWLYPGNGSYGFKARVELGSGFGSYSIAGDGTTLGGPPVNTVAPTVSGAATVGSTWTVNTGTWAGKPAPTFAIYWLRCNQPLNSAFTTVPAGCTAISGANATTYVSTSADAGKYLTAQVAGSNSLGFALAGAANTVAIPAATPVNTVAPTVSGSNTVGSTWTVNPGTWTGTPTPTIAIYWLRCTHSVTANFTTVPSGCTAISGANATTYVATAADAGKYLTAQLAGSNSLGFALAGAANTVAIPAATPVNTVAPTVSGSNTVGSTWTVNPGTWTGSPPPTIAIYWLRCTGPISSVFTAVPAGCTAISGATSSVYVATAADAGKYLTAQLAGSNSLGFALAGAVSTTSILAATPVNTVAPTVSGSNTVGSTWTVNPGTWTGSPPPTIAIYWLRCTGPISSVFTAVPAGCTAISGANATTYVATAADAGKYLTAQLAGSNSLGFALSGAVSTTSILAATPVNTVAPTVSGSNTVGSTWTVNPGTWTGSPPPTIAIYWLRCTGPISSVFTTVPAGCTAISGANATTYVATAADAGKYLTAQLAGSNSLGFALSGAVSTTSILAATPVNTVAPTVSGSATVGSTWTVNPGTWTGSPAPTIANYWLRCNGPISSVFTTVPAGCSAISGATSSVYVSTSADIGKYLTAQLAGSNSLGFALAGAINATATHS